MKQPAPPALVRALLDAADIAGDATVVEVPTPGRVNTTTIIAVGTERYAVRAYGWPFDEPCAFDRRAKEVVVHRRLAAAGVPVAEILSVASVDGLDGALLSYVPGELLGVVAQRVAADELDRAWSEAGAALARVHALDGGAVAGYITADGVHPFTAGSYGCLIATDLLDRASRVGPRLGLDLALLDRVATALVPVLDTAPIRVGHGDANPWNLLVVDDGRGWRVSAWLDWELAWVADPAYDLVRATVQRYAPIGPAPDPFWHGYGAAPDPVAVTAATLHYVVGTLAEAGDTALTPEITHLRAAGPHPPAVLARLADLVL